MNTLLSIRLLTLLSYVYKIKPTIGKKDRFHIFYHAISDGHPMPHLKHLYALPSIADFTATLDFIGSQTRFLTIEEWDEGQAGVLLSFDDGLRQCYDTIAPILLDKKVPAIFFVNTHFIDNEALMYRCKASWIISQLTSGSMTAKYKHILKLDNKALDDLIAKHSLNIDGWIDYYKPYMSVPQIQELHRTGFEIGSHSHLHRHFGAISDDEKDEELQRSTALLRNWIGKESDFLFSFPFSDEGVSRKYLNNMYGNHKIKMSFGISGMKRDEESKHHHRIPMDDSRLAGIQRISAAYLAQSLGKISGNHIRTRS